jgi:hypothetical protein
MSLEIKQVTNRKELKQFIYLPAKIHMNHHNWVPPVYIDEWTFFDPKKNKVPHSESILALAKKGEEVVGRIMGIINHSYNQKHQENHVRFAFMETYNDQEVFHELLKFVIRWGKEKGMDKIVGPLGFTDKDPQGFLIRGFDEPMAMVTTGNFKYMVELIENEEFSKKVELVVYKIDIPATTPPIYEKIESRYKKQNYNLKLLEFTSRRKVKPFIYPVLNLVNETFTGIYGFWPFTQKEMDDMANRYLFLINPRYIKIIINEDKKVVAFVIGMSDLSKGMQKAKGKLFPFGFIHILLAGRKSTQLNLLMGAIHPKYQGKGLDVIMGIKMFDSARNTGKTTLDSHLELESNTKVRAEMERVGGEVYKVYRIYEKDI